MRERPASRPTVLAALRRLLALVLLPCAAAIAAPLALFTDVVGDVRHDRQPVKLLSEADAGHEIVLAADASVVLFYVADGSEWTLRGPARYRVAPTGPQRQSGTGTADKRAAPPAFKEIRLRPDRVRQAAVIMRGHDLRLTSPAHGDVVLDDDVRLAWELRNGRDVEFDVELVDAAGNRLFRAATRDTELVPPATARLVPGERYTWAVLVRAPGGAQTAYRVSEFRVADAVTRKRVDDARPAASAPFSERVLFVALLEHVGATGAAQRQRRALSGERAVPWAE